MAAGALTEVRRRPAPALSALTAVVLVAMAGAAVLGVLSVLAPVPSITDEALYIELARHFSRSGGFEVLGVSLPPLTYAPAYIALISPIYWLSTSARGAYIAVHELNAVVFATAAFPAFFLATRVVSRRTAVIVAAATIALPASVYTTKVQTESLAFVVVPWSVVAAFRVVERPTLLRQAVLVAALALAVATRFELLALAPALAISCILSGRSGVRERLSRLGPLAAGTVLLVVGALALLGLGGGGPAQTGTHGFEAGGFSIVRFGATLVGSFGAVDLYSGVLPVACLLFAVLALRRRDEWVTPALRTLVLATTTGGASLLLISSAYLASLPAESRPTIPHDRYTFYVVPLLVVVFAAVLEAAPRRLRGARVVAAAVGAAPLLAALVYVHHGTRGVLAWQIGHGVGHSGLGFLPWLVLGGFHPLLPLVGIAVFCGWCAYLVAARDMGDVHAYVKPVFGLLSINVLVAWLFFLSNAPALPPPGWLDAHTKGRVIAVWSAAPSNRRSEGLIEMIAANDRLAAVYFTQRPDSQNLQAVERRARVAHGGTLIDRRRPIAADFVVTDAKSGVVGTLVAASGGFRIYKVRPPVRVAASDAVRRD